MGVLLPWLLACGPVKLGDEPRAPVPDAGGLDTEGTPDASGPAESPTVSVSLSAPRTCGDCFELLAEATGGRPPYTIEWDDGSHEALRRVCTGDSAKTVTVTVRDASSKRSATHVTSIEPVAAPCPVDASVPLQRLCLDNPSFEGTPAVNWGLPPIFDAPAWDPCTNPARSNTPDVLDESSELGLTALPKPTNGTTYLGLLEQEQVSQKLCENVSGGSSLSFRLDLARFSLSAGAVLPDTERVFLEVWGGSSADCAARELLWASPPLEGEWQPLCVTLKPQQFMDSLILRARSDETLPTLVSLLADHIVPVISCDP